MMPMITRAVVGAIVCAVFGLVALMVALGGVALLGWGFYVGLARAMDPSMAAVLTALMAFFVAAVFAALAMVALRIGTRPRRVTATAVGAAPVAGYPPAAPAAGAYVSPAVDLAQASQLGSFVGSQVSLLFRSRPLVSAAAALTAGLAVGLLPRLRRTVFGLWR